VTGGDIRLKGHGRGVTRDTSGYRLPPATMQSVYTVEHQIFMLHASDLAPLSSRRDDLFRKFFLGMASGMLLVRNGP